jgi:hypothetical protein
MLQRIVFGYFTLFFSFNINAQSFDLIEINPFLKAGYTANFIKSVDISIELLTVNAGEKSNGKVALSQSPGKIIKKYGKEWISVDSSGVVKIGADESDVRAMELYHPKSRRLEYTIYFEDDSVEQIRWRNIPKAMRLGETKLVGNVTTKAKGGELMSSGSVTYKLDKAQDGYIFCTIQTTIEVATKEQSISKECDLFDRSRNINGTFLEVRVGNNHISSGYGKVQLR